MKIKVSDYIAKFLISEGIKDIFGYPGGMVTHLMDSLFKYKDKISAHLNYNEQGAAFCACGYAQSSDLLGVAYATSGPGATNLITGIANAYFDSIPCIFFTGQVNTHEQKGNLTVRQKGFQELDIVDLVNSITKYSVKISSASEVEKELKKAFSIARSGRPGPVLLDIPMNIFNSYIEADPQEKTKLECKKDVTDIVNYIQKKLHLSKKPIILAGNGINQSGTTKKFRDFISKIKIPVVSSMIAVDVLPESEILKQGFIGAYGHRYANFAISQSDLIISLGSRLDVRQTGNNVTNFAGEAFLIRVDIDDKEFSNKIKADEADFQCDLRDLFNCMLKSDWSFSNNKFAEWRKYCKHLKDELENLDLQETNKIVEKISHYIPNELTITTDVGQNQVWIAQSFKIKPNQKLLFSGGHAAMGYSLPAAIGAYYATKKPVICFTGDGGFQMNIQELQFIARNNLPIKIFLFNNNSLGMIRHFQEMYFNSAFFQTTKSMGFVNPDFSKVAYAYGLDFLTLKMKSDFKIIEEKIRTESPVLCEIICNGNTYVFPKLAVNKPIYDQEPILNRKIYDQLIQQGNSI